MKALSIEVTDQVTIGKAATAATHAVRLGEMQSAITAAVAGVSGAVGSLDNTGASVTLTLSSAALSANVKLKASGFSAGEGQVQAVTEGLIIPLGTTANVAAAGNHTHAVATTSVAGFMSATDKTKLDSVTPLTVGVDVAAFAHTHAVATTSTAGFMSATDKSKLDGLASGGVTNDEVHTAMAAAITDSNSVALVHTDSNPDTFHADVRVKSSGFGATEGAVAITGDGLVVVIGTTANTVAAGNHTHADATNASAGFATAAQITTLESLDSNALVGLAAGSAKITLGGTATSPTVDVDVSEDFAWTGAHGFAGGLTASVGGNTVLNAGSLLLARGTGETAVNWGSGTLAKTGGTVTVDWENQTLGSGFVSASDGQRLSVNAGKLETRKTFRGARAGGTGYVSGDVLSDNGLYYAVLQNHTAGGSVGDSVTAGEITPLAGDFSKVTESVTSVAIALGDTKKTITFPSGFAYAHLAGAPWIEKLTTDTETLAVACVTQIAGGIEVRFDGAPTANNLFKVTARFLKIA